MPNQFLNAQEYANVMLKLAKNQLVTGRLVTGKFKDEVSDENGLTVSVKRPPRFARNDASALSAALAAQDIVTGKVDVAVDQYAKVHVSVGDIEYVQSFNDLMKNETMKSAASTLAHQIDSHLQRQVAKFSSYIGDTTTDWPTAAEFGADANLKIASPAQFNRVHTRLMDLGVPNSDLVSTVTFNDGEAIRGSLIGGNIQGTNKSALERVKIPMLSEIDAYATQQCPSVTSGTRVSVGTSGIAHQQLLAALGAVAWVISGSIQTRIKEQAIASQDASLRTAATIIERDLPGTKVTWAANGNVERIVIDSIPAEFTEHTMIDTIGRMTGQTATIFAWDAESKDFWRRTTNIIKPDGNRAVGTALGQNGASGKADALARFRDYNPGYEYARNESLRGIDSAFNANGGRLSGGALMALQDRASNLADQNYNSWLDRVTALSEQGRTTAVQDATLGAASAGNLAQIYANRGDVKAAGAIGNNVGRLGHGLGLQLTEPPSHRPGDGTVIAESDDIVEVEGNAYFPLTSLRQEYVRGSDTHTTCPWKGRASYYTLKVGEDLNRDAAWFYPEPKSGAEAVAGRVAFWRGVEVRS